MLDTNKPAGSSIESAQQDASKPGIDWLLVAAVVIFMGIVGAIVWNIAQDNEQAAQPVQEGAQVSVGESPTASMVSGFDYNVEATSGKTVAAGVTTQYFGHTEELFPERDLVSGFQYSDDATSAQWSVPRPYRQYFGHSGELYPPKPVSGFDHNTDATTGKSAADGVTTLYFGYNPDFD